MTSASKAAVASLRRQSVSFMETPAVPEGGKVEDCDPKFHEALGRCITRWALLDERLFDLCHAALQTDETRAAIVFYRTPSLEARISLIEELVISRLPKPERKNGGHPAPIVRVWTELAKDMRELLPIRNSMAHHPMTIIPEITTGTDEQGKANMGVRLVPEIATGFIEALRQRAPRRITQNKLEQHIKNVKAVIERLSAFLPNLPPAQCVSPRPTMLQPETATTREK